MSDQGDRVPGPRHGETTPVNPEKEPVGQTVGPHGQPLDEKWLEAFYKECGREATLAYTTLNQMKNWAMIVAAAAISGLSFGTSAGNYPSVPMFLGVVLVYVFVLRFFIRAILCYINLLRWNQLQSDCVALNLIDRLPKPGESPRSRGDLERQLRDDIRNYYYGWLSTINRKTQLSSNLKLGFALLFALPLFFMLQGLTSLWTDFLVKGMTFFAVGVTVVELNDYFKSSFFDDVPAHRRRKSRSRVYEIFPVPASRGSYVISWMVVLIVSIIIARWPQIGPLIRRVLQTSCR
jgi:hypothetical protein